MKPEILEQVINAVCEMRSGVVWSPWLVAYGDP